MTGTAPAEISIASLQAAIRMLAANTVPQPTMVVLTTEQARADGFTLPVIDDMRREGVMVKGIWIRVID